MGSRRYSANFDTRFFATRVDAATVVTGAAAETTTLFRLRSITARRVHAQVASTIIDSSTSVWSTSANRDCTLIDAEDRQRHERPNQRAAVTLVPTNGSHGQTREPEECGVRSSFRAVSSRSRHRLIALAFCHEFSVSIDMPIVASNWDMTRAAVLEKPTTNESSMDGIKVSAGGTHPPRIHGSTTIASTEAPLNH